MEAPIAARLGLVVLLLLLGPVRAEEVVFRTDPPRARVMLLVSGEQGGDYLGRSGEPLRLELDRFRGVGSFDVRFELDGYLPETRNIKSFYFATHGVYPQRGTVRLQPSDPVSALKDFLARHGVMLGLAGLGLLALGAWARRHLRGARRLEASLHRRERELRELSSRLVQAQESGRREAANALHDGLLQYVLAAGLHLQNFREELPQSVDQAELLVALKRFEAAVEEGRRLLKDLRPPRLEDQGLQRAVSSLATEVAEEEGWELQLTLELPSEGLSPASEVALFRVLQEALSNARKHSGTRRLAVTLSPETEGLELSVRDWGRGLTDPPQAGFGLRSMQERAELVGGRLTVGPAPGEGTLVRFWLPLR